MTPGHARTLTGGRRLAACAAASVALHALALAALAVAPAAQTRPTPDLSGGDDEEPEELVYVDIEEPPEAPEAHVPVAPGPEPSPAPEPIPEPAPVTEPDPIPDPDLALADAGVHDADADSDAADAGLPPDAGLVRDAGPGPLPHTGDAGAAPHPHAGDAAPHVAAGPRDAGPASAAAIAAGGDAGPIPAGAAADLTAYAPPGDVVTVLLRLDRIRGTPWEDRVRAIVEPMPDYQAIIGGRDIDLADHLDLLVITSSEPQSITATTLAARSRKRDAAIRELLDHDGAPIDWRDVRGGQLGTRRPGPARHPSDPRVYLLPAALSDWLVLARPEHLGPLLDAPAGGASDPPDWLAAIPDIAAEAGEEEEGPIAVVSATGFPRSVHIPRVGEIAAPRHAAMAVEIDPRGFRIRGTLTFEDEDRAMAFEAAARASIERLVGSPFGRLFLRQMHAYNAARGLSFHRIGERVGYATSVSIADGRAALDFAAEWTARYFGQPPR
jgi:hypothetical protein